METCKLCDGSGMYTIRSELTLSKALLDTKVQCPRCAGKGQVEHSANLDTDTMTNAELVKRLGDQRGYSPVLNEALTRLEHRPEYRRAGRLSAKAVELHGVPESEAAPEQQTAAKRAIFYDMYCYPAPGSRATCEFCHGSGYEPPPSFSICFSCRGSGVKGL
jgi:hypothetical protein